MRASMFLKFLSSTKTGWANVDTIPGLAYRIRTFNPNRMGQIAETRIALNLQARLVNNC